MFVSFKDIQSLPGPLGQVVDGTQNDKVEHEKNMTVLNKYFTSLSTVVAEFGSEKRKGKGKKGKTKKKTKLYVFKNLLAMTSSLKSKYNTFDLPADPEN